MREKSKRKNVWKITIGKKMEFPTVEATLSTICNEMMQRAEPVGTDVQIERVDIQENKTTLHFSGSKKAANAFSKTMIKKAPKVKVTISKVLPNVVRKLR